jgi:hypothetical protein
MAVGAQHDIARLNEAGFQHDVLSDAVVDVKNVFDALPLGEFPDDLLVVGHLFRMGRRLQVERERNLVGIPYLRVLAHFFFKLEHAVGAAEIARRGKIDLAPDALSHPDGSARRALHDFYDHCFPHVSCLRFCGELSFHSQE